MIDYVPMGPEHLDGLVRVQRECFGSGYVTNTFEKELQNKIAFYVVAEENGEVLGYAGLWNMCGSADVMNVGVLEKYRHMGIAQRLLGELEKYCRDNNFFEVNLEVRVSNTPARRLYEKLGYREIAVRKGYYDGKEDGVFMKKILTEEES